VGSALNAGDIGDGGSKGTPGARGHRPSNNAALDTSPPGGPLLLVRPRRANGRRTGTAASLLHRRAIRPQRFADCMKLPGK
jgi:hypothetical protein